MTTNTLPGVVVDASGQPQQKAGRIDTDPAIKSFKTAGEYRLDAGKSIVRALGCGAAFVGFSFATMAGGMAAYAMATNSDDGMLGLALWAAGGIGVIFGSATVGRLEKAVMSRLDDDTRIAFGLKVHAKALQDKVTELHLRASMKDAQGAGEAVGDLGASTPTATITSINGKRT